jgi:hypothetical protein
MSITCFHCKKPLELASSQSVTRIGFRDSCLYCHADLHVCLNCEFHDQSAHHECRESSAEWVKNKERSNICEYFRPNTAAGAPAKDAKKGALNALDDLFKK